MKPIFTLKKSIGGHYPLATGRLKQVNDGLLAKESRVALIGDSTLDNGYWVQTNTPYQQKTATVTHQLAQALAQKEDDPHQYLIANFAVDGATTCDLDRACPLNKVLPTDQDHTCYSVNQLNSVATWQPDIAILSVGGNNYREALQGILTTLISTKDLLFRHTPAQVKSAIAATFDEVKQRLLNEYKQVIDSLIKSNPQLSKIVLVSQYYPALTQFSRYMIYTGFSHIARSQANQQHAFEAMQTTMNELYREVGSYAMTQGKQIIFADLTSSMSPLAGYHTMQIEPNQQGAALMANLIAKAVTTSNDGNHYLIKQQDNIISQQLLTNKRMAQYSVKPIKQFIKEDRYQHLPLFFAKTSSLGQRFESAYHLFVGKQFDAQYTGLFAFGLLDVSLITIIAKYLWRVALDEAQPTFLQYTAQAIALPILVCEQIIALSLLAVLALPIKAYDLAIAHDDSPAQALRV